VGEGGSNQPTGRRKAPPDDKLSEFETGEGLRPIDRKRPLTQPNARRMQVMPSPTRGEGAATNAAICRMIRSTV
jgi:hypothetical protein